jgi:hypothetical protein
MTLTRPHRSPGWILGTRRPPICLLMCRRRFWSAVGGVAGPVHLQSPDLPHASGSGCADFAAGAYSDSMTSVYPVVRAFSGAVRSANAHTVQPASCPGHVVGCVTGQGEACLLPVDGHAHHADDPGDYSSSKQDEGCECDKGGHGGSPLLERLLRGGLLQPRMVHDGSAAGAVLEGRRRSPLGWRRAGKPWRGSGAGRARRCWSARRSVSRWCGRPRGARQRDSA